MVGLGWVDRLVRGRQVRSLASAWTSTHLMVHDLLDLLEDARDGRVRYCLICSIYFELPDPVGATLATSLRRQSECRMCGGSDTDLLAMPVWELQGRLLLAAGMNRVDYLDDSLAFIISEMP